MKTFGQIYIASWFFFIAYGAIVVGRLIEKLSGGNPEFNNCGAICFTFLVLIEIMDKINERE